MLQKINLLLIDHFIQRVMLDNEIYNNMFIYYLPQYFI